MKNDAKYSLVLINLFVFGLLLVFLIPPMSTPDEKAHYLNIVRLSNGDYRPTRYNDLDGYFISESTLTFAEKYTNKYSSVDRLETIYSNSDLYFDSWLPIQNSKEVFYSNSLLFNSTGYIFSTIGVVILGFITSIFFGDQLLTPLNVLMFARFANLVFFLIMLILSINKTKYFKSSILLLSVLPMTIYLASSVSYDAVLIPISFYLFALTVSEYFNPTEKIPIVQILLTSILLAGLKYVYVILLIPLFIVEIKRKITLKKKVIMSIIVLFSILLVYFTITKYTVNSSADLSYYIGEQTKFLISNPIYFLSIIWNTLSEFKVYFLTGLVGKLGFLDMDFPLLFYIIIFNSLGFIILTDSIIIEEKIDLLTMLSFLFSSVILVVLIFAGLYINWTSLPGIGEVGQSTVSGVQGRYLIPALPFLFPLFSILSLCFNKLSITSLISIKRLQFNLIKLMSIFIPAITITFVLIRYYF